MKKKTAGKMILEIIGFYIFMLVIGIAPAPVMAKQTDITASRLQIEDIPAYDGIPFTEINDNKPDFYVWEMQPASYVSFSPLDTLGRTGTGMACLGKETLPTEVRGEIGDIRPSGWQTVRYDDLIEDRYLYNRCHVIGYQLCGDNATPENLFTGTRYLNTEGMLFFENMTASYLNVHPENHILYRVTPIYQDDNLLALGVQMEAFSIEDFGAGLCFNVFVYNIQPGVRIDYATGKSTGDPDYNPDMIVGAAEAYGRLESQEKNFEISAGITEESGSRQVQESSQASGKTETYTSAEEPVQWTYILNTNTKKFHYPDCSSVQDMKEKNKKEFSGTREEVIAAGYQPCGRCNP